MKVRNRILLLASLLLLVSVGGIGNIVWQLPHVEPLQQPRAIVHGLLLLGLFGAGLIFAVLELLRHEIINPIFQLTARIIQMRDRKPDGQLLEFTGNRNIDSLAGALNDILAKRTEKENELENTIAIISRIKDIINQSGYMIFIWKILPGRWPVEFVSDNVADILGYSADDFISGLVSWPAITHPDDVPRLEKDVALYLEKGARKWSQEYRLITKSGEIKWFRNDNFALEDSSGKIITIQAIVHDITGRKRAEEALLFKIMLLEAQSETSIDGILAVDNKGRVILHNKRFGEIWKIPRQILDTKDDKKMLEYVLKQLKDPAEFSRKVAYLYEHKDEKSRDEIEFADGRCYDRYSSPMQSADEQHFGRIWFFRDITERKRTEEKKHLMEERSRKVVEDIFRFIPEGVLVFSRKIELLRQNQAFRELVSGYAKRLGFAEDELENLIIDKVKTGLRDNNIKEIRIARKHETGKQT